MIFLYSISTLTQIVYRQINVSFVSSAYHGHLTTLVELSTYKFKKGNTTMKAPEHVHVVCID
jgi:hypothetical protein